MTYIVAKAKEQLKQAIAAALDAAMDSGALAKAEIPAYIFEIPADRKNGDWSCNVAMAGARAFRCAPPKIAQAILDSISLDGSYFQTCKTAGPGFLNFYYAERFYADVLKDTARQSVLYGHSDYGHGEKVLVEFVSANPTGPMHIGNARGGALGDCLASVLDAAGFDIAREFYVNDAGNQLEKFGMSLDIRYRQLFEGKDAPEMPEDSYHGEDIVSHAKAYAAQYNDALLGRPEEERRALLVEFALPKNIEKMQKDMARYGIHYDRWFFESALHKSGEVDEIVQILKDRNLTYEAENAIWYRATQLGAEKDEVLIRANGKPTYFAVDIAYHRNKFRRGFTRLIDCWGADHHGHVARMKTAMNAIGEEGDMLDIVLYQLVNLVRNGEAVRMSKRTGKAIQLGDLLDEVSVDAARFTFNMHEPNITMDFDLGLAVQEDAQNPVYYVQYAHARICSILRNLANDSITPRACADEDYKLLNTEEEMELIRHISAYPDEIVRAAKSMDPSIVTKYVITLATLFHKFYNSCRVKGENEPLMQARISICTATQTVLHNALTMFRISVPDSM